jgi:hypothetical protein
METDFGHDNFTTYIEHPRENVEEEVLYLNVKCMKKSGYSHIFGSHQEYQSDLLHIISRMTSIKNKITSSEGKWLELEIIMLKKNKSD